jgi:hypothetical protein
MALSRITAFGAERLDTAGARCENSASAAENPSGQIDVASIIIASARQEAKSARLYLGATQQAEGWWKCGDATILHHRD